MPLPAGSSPVTILSGPIVYDPVLSRVRLDVDTIPAHADVVRVERSTDQIVWSTVRGGVDVPVVAGVAKLDDYEFAADVLNHYRIRTAQVLNANPYFETDAANWAAINGTVVRSTAQFHQGVASGLFTPNGVSADVDVHTEFVAATAGATYRVRTWLRCAASRTVQFGFDWSDAGPTHLSDSLTSVAVTANTWTSLDFSAVAPASTAFAQLKVVMSGTPPASHTVHIDEAYLTGPVLESLFSGSITPVLDGVWLKSLARPFLNRTVTPRDFSPLRRPGRGGVFEVVGRSDPIAVTDVRGSKRYALDINTYSDSEAEELDLLLATGDILLVHVPTTGRLRVVPGGYVTVGDSEELVLPTLDLVHRVLSVQLTRCAAPGPDIVGATITCAGILNLYASCSALLAAHPTCADVLSLVGSPGDVLVP